MSEEATLTYLYVEEDVRESHEQGRKVRTVVTLREWAARTDQEAHFGYDHRVAHDTELHAKVVPVLSIWAGLMGAFKESEVYYDKRVLLPQGWRRSTSIRYAMSVFDMLKRVEETKDYAKVQLPPTDDLP